MAGETADSHFEAASDCWCGWKPQADSRYSPEYYECERCGTHVSKKRLRPSNFSEFYSYQRYWQDRQRQKEHPVLEERPEILRSSGRIDKWLEVVARHLPQPTGLAVEVGCAEGTFLKALAERGWNTLGLEPDPETAERAATTTALDIRPGIFPDTLIPRCELFVACDVMEHVPDPAEFLRTAHERLVDNGILFLQQPILERTGGFRDMDSRVFDPEEHAFIFTRNSIAAILTAAGFDVLENHDAWSLAHEIVVARKRPSDPSHSPKLLANLPDLFSKPYTQFIDQLNALGEPHGLRQFCNWSKIWEYPRIWFDGLHKFDWRGKRVIDVGSERSPWPWLLASLGASVTIVEASDEWVPHWQGARERLGFDIDWTITESCQLPAPNSSIDCVTSFSVLEHQEDKRQAVDEALRVLKSGGIFGLSFDVVASGYEMSYPEWNGSAWTLREFEDTIVSRPELEPLAPYRMNTEDIESFLHWHRTTAPHHNYTCAAATFRKR